MDRDQISKELDHIQFHHDKDNASSGYYAAVVAYAQRLQERELLTLVDVMTSGKISDNVMNVDLALVGEFGSRLLFKERAEAVGKYIGKQLLDNYRVQEHLNDLKMVTILSTLMRLHYVPALPSVLEALDRGLMWNGVPITGSLIACLCHADDNEYLKRASRYLAENIPSSNRFVFNVIPSFVINIVHEGEIRSLNLLEGLIKTTRQINPVAAGEFKKRTLTFLSSPEFIYGAKLKELLSNAVCESGI